MVLPAQVLFRKVMICPGAVPPAVETPVVLLVITQSEIRAVAAAPLFWTTSPVVLEIILERSIRTWVTAETPVTLIPALEYRTMESLMVAVAS